MNESAENESLPTMFFKEVLKRAQPLGLLTRHRAFPELSKLETALSENMSLGWVQHSKSTGKGFSLGVFIGQRSFAQIALADRHGRVFQVADYAADVFDDEPVFQFERDSAVVETAMVETAMMDSVGGNLVGLDDEGTRIWLGEWDKKDGLYSLGTLRANLPDSSLQSLEFRDAVAVSFFAAYLIPKLEGFLRGFGTSNIFLRLSREAPLGAIRRAAGDTVISKQRDLRVSGMEQYFSILMHEVDVFTRLQGLEAVHGAEPLHLMTMPHSQTYFFTFASLEFKPAFKALQIEGNLNRFANASAWLDRNERIGMSPTEEEASIEQIADIDFRLLEDPSLLAFDTSTKADGLGNRPLKNSGLSQLVEFAHDWVENLEGQAKVETPVEPPAEHPSEWLYRQGFSSLLRHLKLPYRFDVEFRSNLTSGKVVVNFTSTGMAMMPKARFSSVIHTWHALTRDERATMSSQYNLRVGLMMAALAFGASSSVQEVSVQLDSIGLEEVVEEQDSAIKQLMSTMIENFQATLNATGFGEDVKGAAKDGDVHGNPMNREARGLTEADGGVEHAATQSAAANSADSKTFEEVMRGVDLGVGLDEEFHDLDDAAAAHTQAVKHPTMHHLVTVTFTRDEFLSMIRSTGFDDPARLYEQFDARMQLESGELKPITAHIGLRDAQFAPPAAQEDPELLSIDFDEVAQDAFGAQDTLGISIQREDLLQRVLEKTEELSVGDTDSAKAAHEILRLISRIDDPEVTRHSSEFTAAIINHTSVPSNPFTMAANLNAARIQARNELFSGQPAQAVATAEEAVSQLDDLYEKGSGVPRYFNSYAERVVYNKIFATPGERTVLIPDSLFYVHMELADLLVQINEPDAAIKHLTKLVHYAPTYPLAHLKLAAQFAMKEDWTSARAAALNALRVALDRDDAAFAYYRFAYYSWMRDEFDIAVAAYVISDSIHHDGIPALEPELTELLARVDSQRIPVPHSVEEAQMVLAFHDIVVWPQSQTAQIVKRASRVAVDLGLFVPARTLCLAAARMEGIGENGLDIVQGQFLRSLNA